MSDVVLFDLDGTLNDSIELIERSYRHVLSAHGSRAFDRDEWLGGLGRPLKWQFEQWTADPLEVQRMIATYRAHNNLHHDAMVKPYPGAVEAVRDLKARGVLVGVVTSKMKAGALRGLACAGFDDLFEVVIGCDDVREPKPAPEPALLALERLGASASRAFMVGDSPHDIRCGQQAGTRTAAAMWGPFSRKLFAQDEPDVWLEDPREMAQLFTDRDRAGALRLS
ncbi:MAG TPA: HAD-IA family hydrolase [Planctomycetota bacterium]|nr:HAD-IA family hydrolase [Planctomycetota bacterium]